MEQNTEKGQKRLKGTVLFTVVAVMMVMVVFLMSTLILATASHKRAYYTYYEKQAQYAAQAALDAVTNSAYSDGAFSEWVNNNLVTDGAKDTITVNFGADSGLNITDGYDNKVTCEIEYVGEAPIWDKETGKVYAQKRWKITATAHVGNGANERTESVTNYLYSMPNKQNASNKEHTRNEADATGIGQITETEHTNPGANTPGSGGSKLPAIQTKGEHGAQGNMYYLGPVRSDMYVFPTPGANIQYSDPPINIDRDAASVGDFFYNHSLQVGTQRTFEFQRKNEQVLIYGNLTVGAQTGFLSDIPTTATERPTSYNQLDLVYVDGNISGQNVRFGYAWDKQTAGGWRDKGDGTFDNFKADEGFYPVNVVAGSINSVQNQLLLYGDMYLFNSFTDSVLNNSNGTRLAKFVENNVTKGNMSKTITGNIISNNKSLTVNGTSIGGDLLFTNPEGTLNFNYDAKIDGAVACAGTLSFPQNANLTVKGGLYVDPAKVVIPAGITVTVNGLALNAADIAGSLAAINKAGIDYRNGDGAVIPNSDLSVQINALNMSAAVTGANYSETVQNLLANKDGVIYGYGAGSAAHVLYPFVGRNDEIFQEYVRWDLRDQNSTTATNNANNDPMCQESMAAGHTWGTGTYTDANGGTWYAPYTNATNLSNVAIDKDKIGLGSKLQEGDYYDNIQALVGATPLPELTNANAQAQKRKVRIAGHDKNGNFLNDFVIDNAIVITQSTKIDVSTFGDDPTYFFIDPAVGGKTVIELEGKPSGNANRIYFIVNNNIVYANGDYSKAEASQLYANNNVIAGRSDCMFFFDKGYQQPKLRIYTTGARYQIEAGEMNVVSNPIYPTDSRYADVPADLKYAFELIPNIKIFAEKDSEFYSGNDCIINAEVMMPTAKFHVTNTEREQKITYREDYDSAKFEDSHSMRMVILGSLTADDVNIEQSQGCAVYLGDLNRPGDVTPPATWTTQDQQEHHDNQSNEQGLGNNKYFENQYQGAG